MTSAPAPISFFASLGLRRAPRAALLAAATLVLVACSTTPRPGGFYQDDGPPDRAPSDLARTPDAQPRVEPLHPYANRPYTALGRSFTPMTDDRPFRQRGMASWYGKQFHGNRTASGERYDMFAMTAAHPTLPIPSYVRVTRVSTGDSVIVRVNDRGPFKHDRVIDLSYAAATRLGIVTSGTGEVEVVRLTHADIRAGGFGGTSVAAASPSSRPTVPVAAPISAAAGAAAAAASRPVIGTPSAGGRWSVQLGAFNVPANADALRDRVALLLTEGNYGFTAAERSPRVERDGNLHRVLIGALPDRANALALAERLERVLLRDTALYVR